MNSDRFSEIWNAVVVNAFYCTGCGDDGGSDISHAEMVEIVKMAKDALNGDSKKHLRVWWKDGEHRLSGIVIEHRYNDRSGNVCVKVDDSNQITYVNFKSVDGSEWIDDPRIGHGS